MVRRNAARNRGHPENGWWCWLSADRFLRRRPWLLDDRDDSYQKMVFRIDTVVLTDVESFALFTFLWCPNGVSPTVLLFYGRSPYPFIEYFVSEQRLHHFWESFPNIQICLNSSFLFSFKLTLIFCVCVINNNFWQVLEILSNFAYFETV